MYYMHFSSFQGKRASKSDLTAPKTSRRGALITFEVAHPLLEERGLEVQVFILLSKGSVSVLEAIWAAEGSRRPFFGRQRARIHACELLMDRHLAYELILCMGIEVQLDPVVEAGVGIASVATLKPFWCWSKA